MREWPVNPPLYPIFRNQTRFVWIVAGGPSLRGFNFELLRDKEVVAINQSIEVCPFAKVLYFSDERWYLNNKELVDQSSCPFKITGYPSTFKVRYPQSFYTYKFTGIRGWETATWGIKHGNNSGFAALAVAVKTGAKRIVLLGYDFAHKDGHTHWHEGHFDAQGNKYSHKEDTLVKKMLPYFDSLVIPLKQKRVEIYNANVYSNLNCWPKITIEEALALDT